MLNLVYVYEGVVLLLFGCFVIEVEICIWLFELNVSFVVVLIFLVYVEDDGFVLVVNLIWLWDVLVVKCIFVEIYFFVCGGYGFGMCLDLGGLGGLWLLFFFYFVCE